MPYSLRKALGRPLGSPPAKGDHQRSPHLPGTCLPECVFLPCSVMGSSSRKAWPQCKQRIELIAQQTLDHIALTTYIPCSWRPPRSSLMATTFYQFPLSSLYKTAPQNSKTSATFLWNSKNMFHRLNTRHIPGQQSNLSWSWEYIQAGLVPGIKQ